MENIISAKLRLSFVAFAALLLGCSAHAATLYWDTNGSTPGAGNPADGTWSTNTATWSADSSGAVATTVYTDGSDVVFSAGSDAATAAVTLSGTQRVKSLTFQEGNVTLTGTVDDIGANVPITVYTGANASMDTGSFNADVDVQGSGTFFANILGGGSGLSKTGTGTATFNRLDGYFLLNGGTVIVSGTAGAKLKSATINSGTTLRLTGTGFENGRSATVNAGGVFEIAAGVSQGLSNVSGTGNIVAGNGATLKLGNTSSSGTLAANITGGLNLWAVGTGTLTDNASMEFVISSNGVNNAILGDGTGTIILGGSFNFNLTGADLAVGNSWTLVDVANLNETFGASFSVTGFTESSAGVWTNAEGNLVFSESTGVLSVIPINVMTIMFQTSR